MQAPVYGGTPMHAYGWGGLPQQGGYHFNPNAAVSSYQQPLPPLPPGWEILYDPSGRMYFGCPSRRHVQWKFPHDLVPAAEALPQPMSPSVPIEKPAYIPHAIPQVQRDIEEVDAMDSQGYWYQAFIVKQDEKEALVHFSGWGKETAEKIQISDFPKRIRARSATAATGQGIKPSKEDVRKMFGLPASAQPAALPAAHASVQVQRDIEEVDAMDSQGYWYQAFIVKQDEKEALVHFSGWGKETAEKIQISDFPKRIRARSATAATGQGILPSREDVRKMFGLPAYVPSASPAQLPVGWEVLYDPSGKVYYGNRALMKVQWEHPSEGVTSGKRHLANQYAFMGAVNTIMSLKLRGKQIAPEPETSSTPEDEKNNNMVQKLKMWGTLISDLFKVVMACLLSVFVPQNCPPSETFDKEYWHPCEVQENVQELDPYNSFVLFWNFVTCAACCVLYYAEYRRETFLIEYLDANPAESALDKMLRSNKYNLIKRDLEFHSRNLRRVALFTLIFFTLNILISGLLLFLPQADITYGIGFYLDGRTVTVFISNVLLLIMKLYDTVSLTRRSSKENKAISTALKEPVYFNVIDPRHLKH